MDKADLATTDIPYNLIIESLKRTGFYQTANILIRVGLIPNAIRWMLVRSIEMDISIRKLDRKA